jgi:protein-S-isoprenylcysteine O-methyltransferase Ste14
MRTFWYVAYAEVVICCWVLGIFGAVSLSRASRRRKSVGPETDRGPRSPLALWGLALEVAAFIVVLLFHRKSAGPAEAPLLAAAMLLAPAAAAVFISATTHLGRHMRIQAVVSEAHELVTTGPYRVVRHPIYASIFMLLLSNICLFARLWVAPFAVMLYILGTEIRVHVEDGLLASRFGQRFDAYKARVSAYIPGVR